MKAESESGDPQRGPRGASVRWRVGPRPGTPGPGSGPGAAERRGVGPRLRPQNTTQGPLSAGGDSVRRRTPPSVLSPAAWGRHFPWQTPAGPSWSPAGPAPRGSPRRPTPCHPQNLGFNVYFLIRMPATREPPGGPSAGVGALGRVLSPLSCPHLLPGGRRASQGRRVPWSRHYGSPTRCVWHFLFVCL